MEFQDIDIAIIERQMGLRFQLFEDLGEEPVLGIPMCTEVCQAREWTREEAGRLVGANIAYIKDTTMYVSKFFDIDTGKHVHHIVNRGEVLSMLGHYSFNQEPKPNGDPQPNIRGKDLLTTCIPIYSKIIFDPGCPDPKSGERREINMHPIHRPYNTFKGLKYAFNPMYQIHMPKVEYFRAHALEVLCNNNLENFAYLEQWIGHLFQHPATKPGTAMCFISEQGAGKNIYWQVIMDIITPAYCAYIIQRAHMQGRFNQHLAHKLFVLCDEVTWGGCHETNSLMKARITQPDMMLEKKGCDAYNIAAFERYVVLSNEAWPVKIEQSDRRWAVFDVSPARVNDTRYFDNFVRYHKNDDVMEAIYHYYMNMPGVPKTLPKPPESEAKKTLKDISLADEAHFLRDLLNHENGCEEMGYIVDDCKVTPSGLYMLFQDWCAVNGTIRKSATPSRRIFGTTIARIIGNAKPVAHARLVLWPSHPRVSVHSPSRAYTMTRAKIFG